jgi:hypothetical protein
MLQNLLRSMFSCGHKHTTFPLTAKKGADTYVVCLDCGQEFAYDWERMRLGRPVTASVPAAAAPVPRSPLAAA